MPHDASLRPAAPDPAPLSLLWRAEGRAGVAVSSLLVLDPRAPGWTLRLAACGEEEAVLVLDPQRDGLLQLAELAAERAPLAALRLCGGGEAGRLLLGQAELTEAGLEARGWVLAALGRSLDPRAVIRLEGAAAEGAGGARLMAALAHRTGRDVREGDTPPGWAPSAALPA